MDVWDVIDIVFILIVILGVVVFGVGSVNVIIVEKKIRFIIYEYNYIDFIFIEYLEV